MGAALLPPPPPPVFFLCFCDALEVSRRCYGRGGGATHAYTPAPPPTPTRPLSLTTYYRQSRFPHTPLLTLPLHPPNLPGHIPLTPPPLHPQVEHEFIADDDDDDAENDVDKLQDGAEGIDTTQRDEASESGLNSV